MRRETVVFIERVSSTSTSDIIFAHPDEVSADNIPLSVHWPPFVPRHSPFVHGFFLYVLFLQYFVRKEKKKVIY